MLRGTVLAGAAAAAIMLTACGTATAEGPPGPAPSATVRPAPTTSAPASTSESWTYAEERDTDGLLRTATATGPQGKLVFSVHGVWGRSAYVVPNDGSYECPLGCTVQIAVDGGAPVASRASRPETAETRIVIGEDRKLWAMLDDARTVAVTYPATKSTTATVTVDVVGLDPTKLPGF